MVKISQQKVTLKTISQQLGVSPATVSKALRDSTDISAEMKAKVRSLTEKLGYHPNLMARSLAQKHSNLLGVIIPDLNISYYADLVQGIFEYAHQSGYEPIIMFHHESPEMERKNLQFLHALQVDGILINATNGINNIDFLRRIQGEGIPIVCYDRLVNEADFSTITIDEEKVMRAVLQWLIGRGRSKIAYIGILKGTDVTVARYEIYRDLLKDFGLSYDPHLAIECLPNVEDAERQLNRALESGVRFDAIVCAGGFVAYGAGKAILGANLQMPQDVLLVEFGDNNIVQRLGVTYVAVNQSPYEMSRVAVELIYSCLHQKPQEWDPRHICVESKLVYYDHERHSEEILQVVH